MLAHLSGNRIATGVDHVLYGWVFFGAIIFIMFIIGARWSEPDEAPSGANTAEGRARLARARPAAARPILATVLVGALIVMLPHVALGVLERAEGAAAPARIELPARLAAGWSAEGARIADWTPKFSNPSAQSTQAYAGPQGTVGVHLAYYRGQSEDRKLVSSTNVLIGMRDREWNHLPGGVREVAAGQQTFKVRTDELLGQQQPDAARRPHLVVWRAYWVDGRFIGGDLAAKLAGGLARLRGHGDEGAAIVLYADGESPSASAATLADFVKTNFGTLDALLRQTRDAR
jgi:EpsI family protein